MIRLAITLLTAVVSTLVLAPVGIVAWPFRRDGAVGFLMSRLWARAILFAAGVRVSSEVLAPLPDGPAVFVANHVSALDIPILFVGLPRSFRIIYKRSLFYVPLMGLFLAASRHVAIDRSRAFKAKRSLEAAARRIRSGTSVAIFPEGTRSGDLKVAAFKRGSFKLAVDAQVPVVPVSLVGMQHIISRGRITSGEVRMRVHQAIPARVGTEAAESLAKEAEAVIRREVETT